MNVLFFYFLKNSLAFKSQGLEISREIHRRNKSLWTGLCQKQPQLFGDKNQGGLSQAGQRKRN